MCGYIVKRQGSEIRISDKRTYHILTVDEAQKLMNEIEEVVDQILNPS